MNVRRLVKQAQKGDKQALLQLILAEQDSYYRLAYSYMKNEFDTMDVLEDMIVTLYEKLDQLQKAEAFYSWSKTILVNRCKTLLRNKERVAPLEDNEVESTPFAALTGQDPYSDKEAEMDMQVLLSNLNDSQREAIELRYLHDLPYQTIAVMTGAPVGTIKSRISMGLQKLRTVLGRGSI